MNDSSKDYEVGCDEERGRQAAARSATRGQQTPAAHIVVDILGGRQSGHAQRTRCDALDEEGHQESYVQARPQSRRPPDHLADAAAHRGEQEPP